MISNKLLSEVLKETIREVYKIGSNSNFKQNTLLFKLYGSGELCHINIYELAHKCKEWASINSYALESSVHMQPKRSSVAGCQIHWRYETEDLPYFEADTEPEAIFKACQWILDRNSK